MVVFEKGPSGINQFTMIGRVAAPARSRPESLQSPAHRINDYESVPDQIVIRNFACETARTGARHPTWRSNIA
jgi:hypothetical protein